MLCTPKHFETKMPRLVFGALGLRLLPAVWPDPSSRATTAECSAAAEEAPDATADVLRTLQKITGTNVGCNARS